MAYITLNQQTIEYSVRESRRAKRIIMRLDAKRGLEIVYPRGIRQPAPAEVLVEHQDWVLETLEKARVWQSTAFQRQYVQGAIFPYLGDDLRLSLLTSTNGKPSVKRVGARLDVALPPAVEGNDSAALRTAIELFYRQQAKLHLPRRTREIAETIGLKYGRVYIRNQKTRWGSCSSKGNLNFNLRLMMAPPAAIDYVIIHELCHLVHMNHSRAFWALVAKHCPDWQDWREWFKENSPYLVF